MSFLRFQNGAVPGKKRKTEETNGAWKKKIESWRAYEEKRGSRKFCEKWREGREWLTLNSQNETERMTCSYCIELYGNDGKSTHSNLKGQNAIAIGEICTKFSRFCKSNEGPVKFTCYWTS